MIFAAFGVAAAMIARGYPLGSAARMGPGYFPTVLGGLLALLGFAIVVRGWRNRTQAWPEWDLRSAGLVVASVAVFAALIRPFGLVIAATGMLALACLATRRYAVREVAIVIVALVVLSAVLFAWGLGLPLNLWPD